MPRMCRSTARLVGKTVIITGANQGIGFETAKDLALRGARIIMACRNLAKAQEAADSIKEETKNENIIVHQLDLASLASVRTFAQKINETEQQLNILINNAGLMAPPKSLTEDGFELQFGVNHLGTFLLTNLLLDLLKKSAPSRVVTVSSLAHEQGNLNFDDLQWENREYLAYMAYGDSKLANVIFTRELAKKLTGTGVTAYSLHPGVIKSNLWKTSTFANVGWRAMFSPLVRLFGITVIQGAQTTIHCAVTEGLEEMSGQYFSDCAPKRPSSRALDDAVARRLWEVSEKLVGLPQQGTSEEAAQPEDSDL